MITTPQPGNAKKGRGSDRPEELLMWRPLRLSEAMKITTWKRWPSLENKVKGWMVRIAKGVVVT